MTDTPERELIAFLRDTAYDNPQKVADKLNKAADTIRTLIAREEGLSRDRERYQWLANAVLCCDYGDNEHGGAASPDRIGWSIRLSRRNAEPFIFGQSIDAAIDAALDPKESDDAGS